MTIRSRHSLCMKRHLSISTHLPQHGLSSSAFCLLGALSITACQGGDTHELGFTQGAQDLRNEPNEPFSSSRLGFVGRWIGEATDPLALSASPNEPAPVYEFPSGATSFVLDIAQTLDVNGEPTLTGTLTFGVGQAPPPATDPDLGYPVGLNYEPLISYGPTLFPGKFQDYDHHLPVFEGFAYTFHVPYFGGEGEAPDGSGPGIADGVIQLVYTTSEFVGSWCELQTPHARRDGTFGPLPESPSGYDIAADGTNQTCGLYGDQDFSRCPDNFLDLPVDEYNDAFEQCVELPVVAELSCDKIFLSQFCECTSVSCQAGYGADPPSLLLRASTSGDSLVGAFDNASFKNPRNLSTPLGEVRFVRVTQ